MDNTGGVLLNQGQSKDTRRTNGDLVSTAPVDANGGSAARISPPTTSERKAFHAASMGMGVVPHPVSMAVSAGATLAHYGNVVPMHWNPNIMVPPAMDTRVQLPQRFHQQLQQQQTKDQDLHRHQHQQQHFLHHQHHQHQQHLQQQ